MFIVEAGGRQFEVATCSARKALDYAERRTMQPARILEIRQAPGVAYVRPMLHGPMSRRRAAMGPKVRELLAMGLSITDVAAKLKLPRKTVSDWINKGAI